MRKWLWMIVVLYVAPLAAQTSPTAGYCTLGGSKAALSGMNSTNWQQGVIPGCTVTVYSHGTQTKATIYADSSNTPLSNPFTANVAGFSNSGAWIFWAADFACYDVVGSGGVAPNTYPAPVTLTEVCPGGVAGGGVDLSSPPPIGNVKPNTINWTVGAGVFNAAFFPGSDLGAQINNAIAACSGASNCPVYIEQGTYNITTTINFANGVMLECAGPKTTMLNYTGSGWLAMIQGVFNAQIRNCGIQLQNSALGAILVTNNGTTGSQKIRITGNYFTGGSATSYWVKNTSTAALNNFLFYFQNNMGENLSGYGLWMDHTVDNTLSNNTIYGIYNGTTGHPLVIDSAADGDYIESWVGGASGKVGLTVSNTHNLTTTTASISPGSSVSIPIADSSLCAVGLKPWVIDSSGSFEQVTIASIPDGTHVVVSTVALSHASGSGFQCGQAPLWIFADDVVMDCAHDDSWLFDASLNFAESGILGSGYNFTNSWASGAGNNCYTSGTANANGNGIHISGGHHISISGSKIRANAGNGILVDIAYLGTPANLVISGGNQISGNNYANTPGHSGVKITTDIFGILVQGNRITNDLDNGFQEYAFQTTTANGNRIDFSGNICSNNTIGCYNIATAVGGFTAMNNLGDTASFPPLEHANGPLAVDDFHVGGGTSTWIIPQPGTAATFSQGICANIHWDGSNWVTPANPGNNGGACILGNSAGGLSLYSVPSTGTTAQTISDSTFQGSDKWITLGPTGAFMTKGDIYASNVAGNSVVLHAPSSFTNWTWNWPTGPGSLGQVLTSAGGASAMTWTTTATSLTGTTGSIGGSALNQGTCSSGTVTVTGATVGHPVTVSASDGTMPNGEIVLSAAVTSSNTVTVQICGTGNVTPTAKTYNVVTQ